MLGLNGASKRALVEEFDRVLSLDLLQPVKEEAASTDDAFAAWVEEQIARRLAAKKAKDYALADAIRNELTEKGVVIKDSKEGTTWSLA